MTSVSLGRKQKRGNGTHSHTRPFRSSGSSNESLGTNECLGTTSPSGEPTATTQSLGLDGLINSLNISTPSVMLNEKLMSEMGKLFFTSLAKFNNILQAHGGATATSQPAVTQSAKTTHQPAAKPLPQKDTKPVGEKIARRPPGKGVQKKQTGRPGDTGAKKGKKPKETSQVPDSTHYSTPVDFDNAPTPNVLQESELLYMDTLAESKQRLNLNIYRFVDMCINPRAPTHQEGDSPLSASYDYPPAEGTPKSTAVEITKITTTLEDDDLHFASPIDTKGLFLKAAFSGDVEALRKMSDVSVDYVDDVGRNAIHYASASGSVECVRYLLERGINIDEVDKKGWSALHIAVSKNYTNVAKLLISSGCNIFTRLKHRCAPSRLVDVYSYAIHFAAIKGNVELTKVLIENGATCNDVDSSNMTPLHYAACRGNSDYLSFLIELGADVTIKDVNGRTPFHSAALSGSIENMRLLIDKFGFINEPDVWSLTPLALANLRGHTELYSFLSGLYGESENADSEMTHVLSSTIAAALQEPNVDQIHRCVCRIGPDVCKTIFDLTLQIERNGGVLTSDGKRRRTSGGIFFTLLKELYLNGIISKDDYNYIRAAENEKRAAKVIEKRNRLKNTFQTGLLSSSKKSESSKSPDAPSGKRNALKGNKNTFKNKGADKRGTRHPVKSTTQT